MPSAPLDEIIIAQKATRVRTSLSTPFHFHFPWVVRESEIYGTKFPHFKARSKPLD